MPRIGGDSREAGSLALRADEKAACAPTLRCVRWVAVSLAALALAGCSGGGEEAAGDEKAAGDERAAVGLAPFTLRRAGPCRQTPFEEWAGQVWSDVDPSGPHWRAGCQRALTRSYPARVAAPKLERSIREAVKRSGAHVVSVTVYDFGHGAPPAPVVRLQSAEVARYMLHDLRDFLIELSGDRIRLVELFDERGDWAWYWAFAQPYPPGGKLGHVGFRYFRAAGVQSGPALVAPIGAGRLDVPARSLSSQVTVM